MFMISEENFSQEMAKDNWGRQALFGEENCKQQLV